MASATDLNETWVKLEQGIDQVMNHLQKGMSSEKYMEWYTYVFVLRPVCGHLHHRTCQALCVPQELTRTNRLIYNYCTSSRVTPGVTQSSSMANSVTRG